MSDNTDNKKVEGESTFRYIGRWIFNLFLWITAFGTAAGLAWLSAEYPAETKFMLSTIKSTAVFGKDMVMSLFQ